ncbi:MAG: hypothetical protein ABSE70_11875, partial [Candidatus Limnocylindrales bacterium]
MTASRSSRRRWLAVCGAVALLIALAGTAMIGGSPRASGGPTSPGGTYVAVGTSAGLPPTESGATASATATATATLPDPTAGPPIGPTFRPLDLFVTPSPAPARGAQPTDPAYTIDPRRTIPVQTVDWLTAKAAGRVALVYGEVVLLDPGADPFLMPATGEAVPAARTLDTTWTRQVVEPPGYGTDEKGNRFSDLNYWNLCSPGATTVALFYWQGLTGHPDVTGTAGYFLEPYAAEGVDWPHPGPTVALAGDGSRLGTYWSGSDSVSGYTANGRGFLMYLATQIQPPLWRTTGMVVYAGKDGTPLYPTRGGPRPNIMTALNWEASGRNQSDWVQTWYTSVIRPDPTLARDLTVAVTLDVGRDGVPVIAAVDTFDLPNWQDGRATPHIRHAVAIVGYDNAANPPTFTYIDTCGRGCNNRGGNQNGGTHVISQSQMVKAIQDTLGSGFVW